MKPQFGLYVLLEPLETHFGKTLRKVGTPEVTFGKHWAPTTDEAAAEMRRFRNLKIILEPLDTDRFDRAA